MVDYTAVYPSKTSWYLLLRATETTLDAVNNRSWVDWTLYIVRGNSDTPFNNAGSAWSVGGPLGGSGTFPAFRFGGTGTGTNYSATPVGGAVAIASGGGWVNHASNGTGSVQFSASHAAASTLGTAAFGTVTMTLTTLVQAPGTPTSVVATRISDTQIDLSWTNNYASNGVPTKNKIYRSVNGGAYTEILDIGVATSVSVAAVANQKIQYKVLAYNSAGSSAQSSASAAVYTTPGAPTGTSAIKNGADIDITFTENVDYSEYNHEVWHGTITGGVTTWDGSALTTLASGVLTYKHVSPNPAQVHVYRVRSKAGTLLSAYSISNSVQLLTAPAKPTVPALAAYANRAATFRLPWTHNPLDSSAQTKYQWRWSTNGGSSWTTGSKTTSTNQYHDFAGGTWAANAAVTFQVRTKGQYDSGSDGDASYSPWSDSVLVTFKSLPVATITSPADASTYTESLLQVTLGFSQAEGATFVKAQLELLDDTAAVLETFESVLQVGIPFSTPVLDGEDYTVRARIQDSNGLWSAWDENDFTVDYLAPPPAGVSVAYLEATGWGQISLTIPAASIGQDDASFITITREIEGLVETVVQDYPVTGSVMAFLDSVPTIRGTNTYTVTTISDIGARTSVTAVLVTEECKRAFLSRGPGFGDVGVFGGNLEVSESLVVASDVFEAAGRTKPVGQYGTETSVQMKVSSFVFENFGSTVPELRAILLMAGKACFRDASGRRVFGTVKGQVSYKKSNRADLAFVLTETS